MTCRGKWGGSCTRGCRTCLSCWTPPWRARKRSSSAPLHPRSGSAWWWGPPQHSVAPPARLCRGVPRHLDPGLLFLVAPCAPVQQLLACLGGHYRHHRRLSDPLVGAAPQGTEQVSEDEASLDFDCAYGTQERVSLTPAQQEQIIALRCELLQQMEAILQERRATFTNLQVQPCPQRLGFGAHLTRGVGLCCSHLGSCICSLSCRMPSHRDKHRCSP